MPLASVVAFLIIGIGGPACVAGGVLADRFGRTATTIALMAASGACSLLIGLTFHGPDWLFVLVGLVWGATVIADSGQFSAMVTEVGDPRYVGTALTAQLGLGFALTTVTIWLVPIAAQVLGSWQWAFVILAPGPVVGAATMVALRALPEARRIAHGLR